MASTRRASGWRCSPTSDAGSTRSARSQSAPTAGRAARPRGRRRCLGRPRRGALGGARRHGGARLLGDRAAARRAAAAPLRRRPAVTTTSRCCRCARMTGCRRARHGRRPPALADDPRSSRDLAARAATALENARLYDHERSVAHALQHSLLAPTCPRTRASCWRRATAPASPRSRSAATGTTRSSSRTGASGSGRRRRRAAGSRPPRRWASCAARCARSRRPSSGPPAC